MTSLPTWPSINESCVTWVYLEPKWDPCFDWSEDLVFGGGWNPLKNRGHSFTPQVPAGRAGGLVHHPTNPHRQATQKGTFTRALRLAKFQVGSCCHALCVLGGTGCASGKKRWNWWWVRVPCGLVGWWVGGGRWWPLNIDFWGKKWVTSSNVQPRIVLKLGVDNQVIFFKTSTPDECLISCPFYVKRKW